MPSNYLTGNLIHRYLHNVGVPVNQREGINQQWQSQYNAVDAFKGSTSGIGEYLRGVMNSGDLKNPYRKEMEASANKKIGRSTSNAIRMITQQGANSGFRGTDVNAITDVYANEAVATGDVQSQLNALDLDMYKTGLANKQNAVAQLLGLAGAEQGAMSLDMDMLKTLMGSEQFYRQLEAQQAQAEGQGWGALIGSLLQGAGTAIASDRNLKDNIVYTGETHDGIPIAHFNYKGSPARYKGVIAQDIEELRPDCVTIMEDGGGNKIRTVDYARLGIKLERISANV